MPAFEQAAGARPVTGFRVTSSRHFAVAAVGAWCREVHHSMYQSSFGIAGLPFQLTPDPSFYFNSRGHHRAQEELRRALAVGGGFVVVSGGIGTGKTMLIRTLLAEV